MKHSEARETSFEAVDGKTSPRRAHLARLLREAHAEQRRNTRTLEESYHTLRKSTRLLERRWDNYCSELERELNTPKWGNDPRPSAEVHERRGRRLSKNPNNLAENEVDVTRAASQKNIHPRDFPQAHRGNDFPEVYDKRIATGERTGGQSRSNATHHSDYQGQPAFSRLSKATDPSTALNTLPLPTTGFRSPPKVRIPNGVPQISKAQSPTGKVTARHASLPIQEQLIASSEQSCRYRASEELPTINITSPTPPHSPQITANIQASLAPVRISDFSSSNHPLAENYSQYRPRQASVDGIVNFSLPHARVHATKKQQATTSHRSKVEGQRVQRNA